MRTTCLIVLFAVLATGRAHADAPGAGTPTVGAPAVGAGDRAMMIDVGVGFGGPADSYTYPDLASGRITLGWENAPLPLPETKGYAFGGSLVPELVGGVLVGADHAAGFVGAGLRAELLMAQRDMGLLEVTARGAVYVAVRGLVIGDQREPMIELGIGEYITRHHSRTRIGFELDFVTPPQNTTIDADPNSGMFLRLYVGGAP